MSKKTQRERRSRLFWIKIAVIVSIAVVLLVVAGLSVYWYIAAHQPTEPVATKKEQDVTAANVAREQKKGQLRDSAKAEATSGNVSKAVQIYDQAIVSESDVTRKIQLYVDQSGVLYAAGKYDEAFDAALKAEALSNDKFLAADWLSRIYEDRADYVNAEKYYKMAGEWASSPQNIYRIKKADYDAEAARVAALQKAVH